MKLKKIFSNLITLSGGLIASAFLIFLTDRFVGLTVTNKKIVERESKMVKLRRHKRNQEKTINVQKFDRENFIHPYKDESQVSFDFRIGNESNILCEPGNNFDSDDLTNIFFIGGSTTEMTDVNEKNRFHCTLNRFFRNKDLSLISKNFGVSGNHSMHSNIILLTELSPLKPDYVVLMNNINDISVLVRGYNYWDDNTDSGIFTTSIGRYEKKYQIAKQIKDFLIPNIWMTLKNSFNFTIEPKEIKKSQKNIDFKSAGINYRKSLNTFIAISKAMEIKPIIMTQPSGFQSDSQEFLNWWKKKNYSMFKNFDNPEFSFKIISNLHKEFNEIKREVAFKQNVLLIDLDKKININLPIFKDIVHLNEEGNYQMAEILYKFFISLPGN